LVTVSNSLETSRGTIVANIQGKSDCDELQRL
jgi:hypothetical protein